MWTYLIEYEVYFSRDTRTLLMSGVLSNIDAAGCKEILSTAKNVLERWLSYIPENLQMQGLMGLLHHNIPPSERTVCQVTAGLLNWGLAERNLHQQFTQSTSEIQEEARTLGTCCDVLLTCLTDTETFNAGHSLTKDVARSVEIPVINLRNEIHAPQQAMADLLAYFSQRDSLKGRKVAISWGFGSRFVYPSAAHSMLLIGAILGADVRVVSPSPFKLLRRVVGQAKRATKESGGKITEDEDFETIKDADLVMACNWCSLDDFQDPSKSASAARDYIDWSFSSDTLSEGALFVTEPPVQHDLLVRPDMVRYENNLTATWLKRRIAVLIGTLSYNIRRKS